MAFFSAQNSAFFWGTSIFHNSKGQDCRSLDFFKDSERFFTVVGVYDGHGLADFASMYGSEYLPTMLAKAVSTALKQAPPNANQPVVIATTLCNAMLNADTRYADYDPPNNSSRSGSTVIMCLELNNDLYFINTGDSRACIGRLNIHQSTLNTPGHISEVIKKQEQEKGETIKVSKLNAMRGIEPPYFEGSAALGVVEPMSIDHCASHNAREISRCRMAGATVSQNRLFPETCLHWWSFMLTRTLGNTFSKGKAMVVNPDIFRKKIVMSEEDVKDTLSAGSVAAEMSMTSARNMSHSSDSNPRPLKNPSVFYDLRTGTIGDSICDPVDYVILGSDGVWAVLSNEEVHAVVQRNVSSYIETGDIDNINPCLIASELSHIIMKKVAEEDLYADDITIVLGFRKSCIFAGNRGCDPSTYIFKQSTGECIDLVKQKETLKKLDAWYSDIQSSFKTYYKSIAMHGACTYDSLLKLLYTNNSVPMTNMLNKYRFLLDVDRIIKEVHTRYKILKGESNQS